MIPRSFAALLALVVAVAGCSSSSGSNRASSSGATSPATAPSSPSSSASSSGAAASASGLYVSIGDSYGAGFQPTGVGRGHTTRNGFAYQVVRDVAAKGDHLTLANFACAGATTTSMLRTRGCSPRLLGPGARPYPGSTQAAAAERFVRAHRGQVALITVSIGGNDVTKCGAAANPTACIVGALTVVKQNLATLLRGLRAAGGPSVRIVGTTYPDVLLADMLSKNAATRRLGRLSVLAFRALINPALQSAYAAAGARFVDVTAATGAYGPMSATTTLPPYGKVPVPVAKICRLTYFCQYDDIHPRTQGYAIIARLVEAMLPTR